MGVGRSGFEFWVGAVGFPVALALITVGLLSSTLHLGRPERAWRAFSQWRSSWLSREGIAAVATYVPALALAALWIFDGTASVLVRLAATATLLGVVATVWCTGMIYASLPTVRLWYQPLTAPIYLAIALATGAVLLNALLMTFGAWQQWVTWIVLVSSVIAWTAKAAYWDAVDTIPRSVTLEDATGLGRFGTVKPLVPPHTQANYVMREMGYRVARKHRVKLRRIATVALFIVPIVSAVMLAAGAGIVVGGLLAAFSVLSAGVGVFVERWLFFAEAEHVSMVYYDAKAA
jgi:DMSO reductase anchor subunit